MAGMFVPQMVAPVDTRGLAQLGQSIGQWRQDSAVADIMKGLDASDPTSANRVISDLRQRGDRQSNDMADRFEGVLIQRGGLDVRKGELDVHRGNLGVRQGELGVHQGTLTLGQRKQAEVERAAAEEEKRRVAADRALSVPTPIDEGVPTPAPQRVSSGVFDQPDQTPAPVAPNAPIAPAPISAPPPRVMAPAPQQLQQLPAPPPRNVAGTGVEPASAVPVPQRVGPAPTGAPGQLPSPPAPLRTQQPPTGIGDLLLERQQPIPRPSTTSLERQIQTQLDQLEPHSAYEGVKARIASLRANLANVRARQDEEYKAKLDQAKTTGNERYKHALDAAKEINKQSFQDDQTAFSLGTVYKVLENGINTGSLSDTMKWTSGVADTAGKIAELLGGDGNKIAAIRKARDTQGAMDLFHGLAAKSLSDIVGSFGKVTEKEGERLDRIIAGMSKSITGNVRLVKFARDLVGTRQAASQDVRDYMRQMGSDADPAHISEIQARHFRGALQRIETEVATAPWGLNEGRPKPGAEAPAAGTTGAAAAADKTPAARGGQGGPAIGEIRNGRPYLGGPLNDSKSWGPRAPGPGGA